MRLQEALESLPGLGVPADFGRFRQHIAARWVHEALAATGTATVRRRRLPAEQVVWLVVGMALMRNESIERVVALLDLALPTGKGTLVAKSAITQSRERLGAEPLEHLFLATGAEWAKRSAARHQWRGLSLFGIDGSTLRVPDSQENWDAFGGHCGNGLRDGSAYPTVRVVALMALRSHLLMSLCFSDYLTGESTLAKGWWRELPEDSLVVVDRNFLIASELSDLEQHGRQWLTRAKSTTRLRRIKRLGPNDDLVEIELNPRTRRSAPEMPQVWQARAIRYHRRGFRPATLLTSLLDPKRYPASELLGLYHERWELEVGYDEIKTHLLAREETIRSRTPDGVRQELWGMALAYNLVRLEMERTADELGVDPTRISFVAALTLIRNAWLIWSTPPLAPGRIPDGLLDLRRSLKLLLLPERRPTRSYPRAVKIKLSPYTRKRSTGSRLK
jgi:hypothetical protein